MLLVLDKQQGKVSAVKGINKDGYLQTVLPTQGGEFTQVEKNSNVFSNFISNFDRKYMDTSGLELFSVRASEVERHARAIEDNHRNPTPEDDKRAEMLRVPKPDFHEFKQGYRFDPAKIDWENLYLSAKFHSEANWLIGINATQALSVAAGQGGLIRQGADTHARDDMQPLFGEQEFWQLKANTTSGGIGFTTQSTAKWEQQPKAIATPTTGKGWRAACRKIR